MAGAKRQATFGDLCRLVVAAVRESPEESEDSRNIPSLS